MHVGINRPDGRHWCAPNQAPEGEVLVICDTCGKVWSYDMSTFTWSQLSDEDVLPGFPDAGEAD